MEGDESTSSAPQEDSPISLDYSTLLTENVEGFQQCVNDVLEEVEQDEGFSEMTAQNYDLKKSYLKRHLTKLSCMHEELVVQHAHLIEEVNKNSASLINKETLHSSDSSSLQVSQMLPTELKSTTHIVRTPDVLPKKKSTMDDELVSINKRLLEYKNSKLMREIQDNEGVIKTEKAKVIVLQKRVAELEQMISDSNLIITTMGDELETTKKKLSIARDVIANLNDDSFSNIAKENQILKHQISVDQKSLEMVRKKIDSQTEQIRGFHDQVQSCLAKVSERENKIRELNKKNNRCQEEISQLESLHKTKELIWNDDVGKLKVEAKTKGKTINDLVKRLDDLKLEKDKISAQLDSLQAEKCSQDKQIQELETRFNSLQVEHDRILSFYLETQEVKSELTLRVAELEREVGMQKEVISARTEEKMEAIRQLSSSLEHYMSRYKELRQAYIAKRACCFDFLS